MISLLDLLIKDLICPQFPYFGYENHIEYG